MFEKMTLRMWVAAAVSVVGIGCGGVDGEFEDDVFDPLAATQAPIEELPYWETCSSAGWGGEPEPPYKKNPDVECTLISKYNGDIDAGFDVSGGSYDAFKQCMTDAGCFNPASGTQRTEACDQKLTDCQVHLIGSAATGLTMDRDFDTITADQWASLGADLK